MILAERHTAKCTYGCCGTLPDQKFLTDRRTNGQRAIKRALKKRDRQEGRKEISEIA